MSYKRARSTSYGNYAEVSQSQNDGYRPTLYRPIKSRAMPKKLMASKKRATTGDVNRILSKRIEGKHYNDYGANQSIIVCNAANPPSTRNLLPVLSQGLGQGNRIGNAVRVRSSKLVVFVNVTSAASDIAATPTMIRVWIVSSKILNTNAPASLQFTDFFQLGSSNSGFQGNMLDMLFPVNTDNWTVYMDKTIKVGLGSIPATNVNNNYPDNSSFNHKFEFDWSDNFKSKLDYDDAPTEVTNRNLFMVYCACRSDGASATAGTTIAEFHFTNNVIYEDA